MNTIISGEMGSQADGVVSKSFIQSPKRAEFSGILSLLFTGLATISIFVPFSPAFLYWNFHLISAALGVFGFLEIRSGKAWITNITWTLSMAFLVVLFIFAFNAFQSPQSFYFYGAFSIIVPILLMITALTAEKTVTWKDFAPLIALAFFIGSALFLRSRTTYLFFFLPAIGWGLLGLTNHLERKN
jgi:hypothetical protein